MYTDLNRLQNVDRMFLKPKKIFIHHTVDLLIHQMKGTNRFDTAKPSFPQMAKMCYQDYRYLRFFSHYYIEQVEEDFCIIVGTSEDAVSEFMLDYYPENQGDLLILIAGDYSFDIPPKELYIRLGQICSTLARQYKLPNLDSIQLLENLKKKTGKEIKLTPMSFFNRQTLNSYIKL